MMNTLTQTLRREARVIFSRRAQPVWFRILKWIAIIAFVKAFHARPWFWSVLAGVFAISLAIHFFYRWKTRAWTHSWGGWNDLEAGRE